MSVRSENCIRPHYHHAAWPPVNCVCCATWYVVMQVSQKKNKAKREKDREREREREKKRRTFICKLISNKTADQFRLIVKRLNRIFITNCFMRRMHDALRLLAQANGIIGRSRTVNYLPTHLNNAFHHPAPTHWLPFNRRTADPLNPSSAACLNCVFLKKKYSKNLESN